ncbi:MAG: MarR family transcriptional regulator [Rhizomicrobium sp.]
MVTVLNAEIFHLMRRLMQAHTAVWQAVLPELTKPQYAVLRAIAEQPGIEQFLLVEAAASSKATLAELLNRLEQRGVITRRQDPADKRRRFVSLTKTGQQLLQNGLVEASNTDGFFLDRLSKAERAELHRLLQKMMPEATNTQ